LRETINIEKPLLTHVLPLLAAAKGGDFPGNARITARKNVNKVVSNGVNGYKAIASLHGTNSKHCHRKMTARTYFTGIDVYILE
jgi:hypothetical protein